MKFFQRLRQRFVKPALPVVVVGTDIASYQLIEQLRQTAYFAPVYVLNEEPWHHKTFMLGVQLRYSSELLALVEKHNIAAVLCVTSEDYERINRQYQAPLTQLGCALCLLKKGELPDYRRFVE